MDWPEVWEGTGPRERALRAALVPLSHLYALGWRVYRGWYRLGLNRRVKPDLPIVGVGSVVVGGAGKTPLAVETARMLLEAGKRPAVSVNGYGGDGRMRVYEPEETPDPAVAGEEAALIRQALPGVPIVVGRRRLPAARRIAARGDTDALVLDDGFQHLPLARDLDIVAVTGKSPVGNSRCLPAGPLREPKSGLRRAGALLVFGPEEVAAPPGVAVFHASRRPSRLRTVAGEAVPLDSLQGRAVTALSALGSPASFECALTSLGARVTPRRFPDHHAFRREDLRGLEAVVTTAKDAVKLVRFEEARDFWVLEEEVAFDEQERFREFLLASLFGPRRAAPQDPWAAE